LNEKRGCGVAINPIFVKNDSNFHRAEAGHAREYIGRGYGPLLPLTLFLIQTQGEQHEVD